MIVLPIAFDQFVVAREILGAGFGLIVNFNNYSAQSMKELISQVAATESPYRKSVGKISKLLKSRKHPSERAADEIKDVFTYGWNHLRFPDEVNSLNFFQFYMIDVLCFIFFILLLFTLLCLCGSWLCIVKCFQKCRTSKIKTKFKKD